MLATGEKTEKKNNIVPQGTLVGSLNASALDLQSLSFSSDDRYLLGLAGRDLYLWELAKQGKLVMHFRSSKPLSPQKVSFNGNNTSTMLVIASGKLNAIDIYSKKIYQAPAQLSKDVIITTGIYGKFIAIQKRGAVDLIALPQKTEKPKLNVLRNFTSQISSPLLRMLQVEKNFDRLMTISRSGVVYWWDLSADTPAGNWKLLNSSIVKGPQSGTVQGFFKQIDANTLWNIHPQQTGLVAVHKGNRLLKISQDQQRLKARYQKTLFPLKQIAFDSQGTLWGLDQAGTIKNLL